MVLLSLLQLLNYLFYRVKQASRGKHEWASLPVPTSKNYLLVTGLLPGTGYQFSVLPQNKLGSGSFSEIVSTRTRGLSSSSSQVPPHVSVLTLCPLVSCANRTSSSGPHGPGPGPPRIVVSEPDGGGGGPPVVPPCHSLLLADGLRPAGPQEPGTVGHPQQQHQRQSDRGPGSGAAQGNAGPHRTTHTLLFVSRSGKPGKGHFEHQCGGLSFCQDCYYELRLMSRSNTFLSEPSEPITVSTFGW